MWLIEGTPKRRKVNIEELLRLLNNAEINEAIANVVEELKDAFRDELKVKPDELENDYIPDSKIIPLNRVKQVYIEDPLLYVYIMEILENPKFKDVVLQEYMNYYKRALN